MSEPYAALRQEAPGAEGGAAYPPGGRAVEIRRVATSARYTCGRIGNGIP